MIKEAISEWERNTCIRFVERTDQVDYVEFAVNRGYVNSYPDPYSFETMSQMFINAWIDQLPYKNTEAQRIKPQAHCR